MTDWELISEIAGSLGGAGLLLLLLSGGKNRSGGGAAFHKFNSFGSYILDGSVVFTRLPEYTVRIMLTNRRPKPTDKVYADIRKWELPGHSGYRRGGVKIEDGRTTSVDGIVRYFGSVPAPTWTATAYFGPFQYVVIYIESGAKVQALMGYFDQRAPIPMFTKNTFTVGFNEHDGIISFG